MELSVGVYRLDQLCRAEALLWVSLEPLLGQVALSDERNDCLEGCRMQSYGDHPFEERYDTSGLDWVICGGESGPGARPMHPDWARSVRDQCVGVGVPFFLKQWGDYQKWSNIAHEHGWDIDAKKGGRLLDGREWNQMPGRWRDLVVVQGELL